jgi:uncharacterized pyridoxamine 5'-phosphate oxidase family protein
MFHKSLPKANLETLSERQRRILHFLDTTRVGVLTSVDPNGNPHGSVVYFAASEGFALSFITKQNTKKADNILKNNHVMLVVFDPSSQTVAQVTGKAVKVANKQGVNAIAAAIFMTSISDSKHLPPIAAIDAGDFVAFRIEPDQIRMATYGAPESGDHRQIFESIESFELKT